MSDKLFYQLVHHGEHLVLYSFVIWQAYFALRLLLEFVSKNFKFETKVITPQTQVIEKQVGSVEDVSKKNLGAIDVKVDKNIFIGKPDKVKVKLDEVKKAQKRYYSDDHRSLKGRRPLCNIKRSALSNR